jgi:hypothetical protein
MPVQHTFTAKTLLQNITGCTIVYSWDAANATAHIVTAGSPPETDFPLEEGGAYFVATTSDTNFSIEGLPLEEITLNLYPGWNMVGWCNETNTTAKAILFATTNCTIVYWYDPVTDVARIVTENSPPDSDFTVTKGMGLFVAVTSGSQWVS